MDVSVAIACPLTSFFTSTQNARGEWKEQMAERKSPMCRKDSDELPRGCVEAVLTFVGSWSWALTGPSGQKSFLSVLNSRLEWT